MADEPKAAPAAARAAQQATSPAADVAPAPPAPDPSVSLTPKAWGERARRLFGVSPYAVAGALWDKPADETLSEDQVREALDAFSTAEGVE